MSENPDLNDIIEPTEQAIPDHHAHAKTPAHLNDDELARRVEQERVEVGLDDYDPNDVPPAAE